MVSKTEDNLQEVAYKLNHIITEHGLTIPIQKIELMALEGREQVGSTIVVDNKIIEQVSSFNCLGSLVSCEEEMDIDSKLYNCLKMTGIISNIFRPQ